MLMARGKSAAYVNDGKIYVVGGFHNDFTSPNYKEVFDPKTQTWKPEPRPDVANEGTYEPDGRSHRFSSCCVIDNVYWWYED